MPRYIDADAFIKEQCNSCDGYCEKVDCDCLSCDKPYQCGIIQGLKNAPTVSPDEVRGVGKWDRVETEFGLRCPKCGKLLDEYVNGGEWVALSEIPNYCPNCGAKMEVSE